MVSTAAFLNVIVVDCVASSAWDRAGAVVILAACSNSSAKPKLPTREETAWLCISLVFQTTVSQLPAAMVYSGYDLLLFRLYPHYPEQAFNILQSFFKVLTNNIFAPLPIFHCFHRFLLV